MTTFVHPDDMFEHEFGPAPKVIEVTDIEIPETWIFIAGWLIQLSDGKWVEFTTVLVDFDDWSELKFSEDHISNLRQEIIGEKWVGKHTFQASFYNEWLDEATRELAAQYWAAIHLRQQETVSAVIADWKWKP